MGFTMCNRYTDSKINYNEMDIQDKITVMFKSNTSNDNKIINVPEFLNTIAENMQENGLIRSNELLIIMTNLI